LYVTYPHRVYRNHKISHPPLISQLLGPRRTPAVRATREIIQQSLDDFVGFVIDVINPLKGALHGIV
jgi:hypothetical protein